MEHGRGSSVRLIHLLIHLLSTDTLGSDGRGREREIGKKKGREKRKKGEGEREGGREGGRMCIITPQTCKQSQ